MSSNSRGLAGRNLHAARQQAEQNRIIQSASPSAKPSELLPNPENGRDVREEFADPRAWQRVLDLAAAVRTDGINTALTVVRAELYIKHYPKHREYVEKSGRPYVVIHGHRRLAAAMVAELAQVPIMVKQDVESIRIAAIQENLLREDLDPIAEGLQYRLAMAESNLSQRALAKRLGNVSQTTISHRLAILDTIPEIQKLIIDEFYEPRTGIGVAFAAKHVAKVLPSFQRMFVSGELKPVEVVALSVMLPGAQEQVEKGAIELAFAIEHLAHLRDEFQKMFLNGEITAADVMKIAERPAAEQQWPLPPVEVLTGSGVIAGQSPQAVVSSAVPTPRGESAEPTSSAAVIAGQSPGAGAVGIDPAAEKVRQEPLAGSEVIAGQSPETVVGLAAQGTVATVSPATMEAAPAVIAGQSSEAAPNGIPQQPTDEATVVLIGSPSAEQIAQALIDHLAPEVIAAVREYLT